MSDISALNAALAEVDKITRQMIADELREKLPGYESREEKAAARLRDALEALQKPQEAISELSREIAKAEGESGTWRSQLDSGDISARVAARAWFREWDEELSKLHAKRDAMERDLAPLISERDTAKRDLENATTERLSIEVCTATGNEYFAAGKTTLAYKSYRFSGPLALILAGDKRQPEFGDALEFLEKLCLWSGYRTDHLRGRPDDWRKFWDGVAIAGNPVPTAQDIIQTDRVALENLGRGTMNRKLAAPVAAPGPSDWAAAYRRR